MQKINTIHIRQMLFEYKNRTTIFHSHSALTISTERLQPSNEWTINIIHCSRYLLYGLKTELKSKKEGIFSVPHNTYHRQQNRKARHVMFNFTKQCNTVCKHKVSLMALPIPFFLYMLCYILHAHL